MDFEKIGNKQHQKDRFNFFLLQVGFKWTRKDTGPLTSLMLVECPRSFEKERRFSRYKPSGLPWYTLVAPGDHRKGGVAREPNRASLVCVCAMCQETFADQMLVITPTINRSRIPSFSGLSSYIV